MYKSYFICFLQKFHPFDLIQPSITKKLIFHNNHISITQTTFPRTNQTFSPIHRQFRAALPHANGSWAPLVEAKSTAYEDLGRKAFLTSLVVVSS